MKKKSIPAWVTTAIWVLTIMLTAYFAGQSVSLYVKKRLQVKRTVTLARQQENQDKDNIKPLGFYQSSIGPALTQGKKTPGSNNTPRNTPRNGNPNEPGNPRGAPPVATINWDQILAVEDPAVDLKGTVIGDDMAIAFVRVEGKDLSLSIGQKLGGYRVVSINKNTIGFSRGGPEKTISMTLKSGGSSRGSSKKLPRPKANSRNGIDLKDMISFQGNKRVIDRRKFNALLKPPSRLANELKFIPNSKNSQPYGIKISYLKPGSFFSRIGMRSGDILVRTNKKELKSVEDSFYAYQAFRNEDHLTLEIDRGGRIVKIPMEFR